MKHAKIEAFNLTDAWYKCLRKIWDEGDIELITDGSEVSEMKKLNVSVEIINPEIRPILSDYAPNNITYVNEYFLRYLWTNSCTEDEHYTYGSRLREPVDQIQALIDRIVENPKTRQLTLVVRRPEDIFKTAPLIDGKQVLDQDGNPVKWEPPCLTIMDFEVMNNLIHLTGYFRSWDCYGGFPINLAGIQLLLEGICNAVNNSGSEVYGTGKQIWHCKNLHIYSRQFPFIKKFFEVKQKERNVKGWDKRE